ncbi:MAG: tetratricopeptide repeat protein [Candidatus Puniceispirillales bacterium]
MLDDAFGNPVGTLSVEARDAYDLGVRRFLGAELGVSDAFKIAINADEGFALAYIGLARNMQLLSQPDGVKANLTTARNLAQGLSARERSHIEVSALLLEGNAPAARAAVYEHVKEWPTDVMIAQMCTSVFGLIGFSGLPGREAEQLAFITTLMPHYGNNWWYRTQLAFAQLEVGQLDAAEVNIEVAMNANPRSAHTAHIRAHLYYENMEDKEGLSYLSNWCKTYDPSATLYNHIYWHIGLWSLETGDIDRMWQVLDINISPEKSQGPPLNVLTDAASLLFRAELAGLKVPVERWNKLSVYALSKFPNPGLGFADLHAAISHSRSGNRNALDVIIDSDNGAVSDLTKTLATGYREMEDGNWAMAAKQFCHAMRDHARIGGSKAQRDLIDYSLASCLVRDGRQQEARTLLSITRPHAVTKEIVAGL